jgi:hypothetical protein
MNRAKIIIVSLFIFFVGFNSSLVQGNELCPLPKQVTYKKSNAVITHDWYIICNTKNKKIYNIARKLQEYFKDEMALTLEIKSSPPNTGSKAIFFVDLSDGPADTSFSGLDLPSSASIKKEGYILESDVNRIIIAATDEAGLFYGTQTLKDLSEKKDKTCFIDCVSIKDWPDFEIRAVHILAADYNDKALRQIELLAKHKYNTVIFEHRHIYDLNDNTIKEAFVKLFNYCRELYIEPAIDIGSPMPVLSKEPNAASGVYIKDEPFIFEDGEAVAVHSKDVYIANSGFENFDDKLLPTEWKMGKGWTIDANTSYGEGTYSAMIDIGDNGGGGCLEYASKIDVDGDTWYGLRFFAKTSSSKGPFAPAVRILEYNRWGMPLTRNLRPIQHIYELNKPNRNFWQEEWHKAELVFKTQPNCKKIVIYADVYESTAQAWFDEFRLIRLNSTLANIVTSDILGVKVYNNRRNQLKEGKDYIFEKGDISFLDNQYCYYDFESKPFVIMLLPGSQIKENEKVFVSYNAAFKVETGNISGIPYCISEPKVYQGNANGTWQGIYNIIDETIVTLDPKYILYSHASEMKGLNRDGRDLMRNVENYELLAEDINNVYDCIRMNDDEIGMMVWDDMLNPRHNGGNAEYQVPYGGLPGETSRAIDLIPKDVLIVIWWYDLKDDLGKMDNSPDFFETKGFKYLVAGYDNLENIKKWCNLVKDKEMCEGVIITTWNGFKGNKDVIVNASDYLW